MSAAGKSINTALDWRTSYERAQRYLSATNRLVSRRLESIRDGDDLTRLAKQNAMIRRDVLQLGITHSMLTQQAESLKNTHSITSREYMDFIHDLSAFEKSLKALQKRATVSLRDADERYCFLFLFFSYLTPITASLYLGSIEFVRQRVALQNS